MLSVKTMQASKQPVWTNDVLLRLDDAGVKRRVRHYARQLALIIITDQPLAQGKQAQAAIKNEAV